MYSPSQRTAQITANPNWSNKGKRRRRARPSILGFGEDSNDEKLPSTPLNRTAAHKHVDAFSPFNYRSSNDSPRAGHVSSPSVILFSGPDDRGFERVHDDSFPQDLALLKSMARSKFKLTSAAPVEMSYVNPDGIVCDLDDEHDLRALAVHASLAPKLRVRVTSSAHPQEAALSQSEAAAQQAHASTNGTSMAHSKGKATVAPALLEASQNDAPSKTAVMAAVPGESASSGANGHSANGATLAKSRRKSSANAGPSTTTSASTHTTKERQPEVAGNAATIVSSLVADSASQASSSIPSKFAEATPLENVADAVSASQPVTPAAKKTSAKRKRADFSSPPSASSSAAIPDASPGGPVAKKPRGRSKKSLPSDMVPANSQLAFAESQGGLSPILSTSEMPAPAVDALAAPRDANGVSAVQENAPVEAPKRARANKRVAAVSSQTSEQELITADTPKRGRPRKSVPTTTLPSTQDTAAGQEGGALETPKGDRAKKAPASAVAAPPQSDITPPSAPTNNTEPSTAMTSIESRPEPTGPQLNESAAVDQRQRSEPAILDPIPVPNSTPAGKPRGRPSKKAIAEAEAAAAAAALKDSQEVPSATPTKAATEEQPSQASQPAITPAKKARASKAAKVSTSDVVESVQDKQPDAPTSLDVDSAVAAAATDVVVEALSASEAAPSPMKKKVGRPKAVKATKEAAASTPTSSNDPQSTPDATTETSSRSSSDAPLAAVPAVPKKKLGRPTNAAKAAKAAEAAEAAAKAAKAKEVAVAAEPAAVSQPAVVAAPAVEEQAPVPSASASSAVNHAISSQLVGDATATSEIAAKDATQVDLPSSSVPSAPDSTPADASAASPSAATKRAIAAKARASKASRNTAASEPVAAIDACIACGATPSHDREGCPIWQGGSQSILDLLAMVRKRKPKSQKDKELTRLLTDWLAKQFGAPTIDFTASQESIKPSQEVTASACKNQSANAAANGAVTQPDSMQAIAAEPSDAVTTASQSKQAPPKSTATKRSTAKAAVLAPATPEPELPPPSGIEVSSNDAAAPVPVPASPAKAAARGARGSQSKTATIAAKAKAAKKSAAEPSAEPKIALTPSSPPQPEPSQSPNAPGTGLRAPSESSEAELATSPMLSAVPRANGDMDVDEMPPQTPSQPNTAAQQLEERKRRMKLADQAVAAAAATTAAAAADGERASSPETASTSRSRSASITSSDSSGDGRSSGDDSDARSDADAGKKGRREAAKQAKFTSTKAARSRATPAKASRAAAKETASSSDSETSSSDSETESEAEASKKSTPRAKNGAAAGSKAKTSSTSRSAQRLAAPDNPFLRGLTPLSSRRSNGTGSTSQKSTPFTRLSELKPGIFRQNMSQPGSPLSTGGSTPLSASSQTPFFASQPAANGNGNESGSAPDTPVVSAAATSEAATPVIASDAEDDDEVSSSSSSSSSSEDEAPRSRGKRASASKGGGGGSTAAKRAGKRASGVAAAKPATAKKRKSMFDVFA
ncbi:hypothetical protein PHSY_002537 [Pseudozyma hubeiensis SY62]|uniref:Uncharacterized protein n=1 Tax=Pseudozyma hubeiensis (strain SY62) TaxID=1305764 RepID=R9P1C5_PSEHS|nr:hypothetical protein PHSY_002537 [Pseudozyma hubeiensis SY62]GAC94964.1 hypothetical protein PHSY_002537 [Pseudozyma hubeiensis SY62]